MAELDDKASYILDFLFTGIPGVEGEPLYEELDELEIVDLGEAELN